jgi:hypothetical protein
MLSYYILQREMQVFEDFMLEILEPGFQLFKIPTLLP